MRDVHIRTALKRDLEYRYENDPSTMIVDELALRHGASRVDVAVINGLIHGFELKSDRDTLARLPSQVRIYNSVLDRITLVVGQRHLSKSIQLIPDWWGIDLAARGARGKMELIEIRPARNNPLQDILAVSKLLWREEALTLLEELGKADCVRRKRRAIVYEKLVEVADCDLIRDRVRHLLRNRKNWRFAGARKPSDG